MALTIRKVLERDLDAVFGIYDDEVQMGTATFDTAPSDAEGRRKWLETHSRARHPALVALNDDGDVVGWASLSPFSDRRAYARSAEVSVYVHARHRGQGIGRALLEALVIAGRAAGLSVLMARITSESSVSLALHRALGFSSIGTMRRVGEKFGRVLDVELLDLHLDGG